MNYPEWRRTLRRELSWLMALKGGALARLWWLFFSHRTPGDGQAERRHHHGVPVRHQLGLLLALCRRHLRRAARSRGPDGVLSGSDLRRPVLLRLGAALARGAPRGDGAGGARLEPLGAVDSDRQRVDAAPGRRAVQLPDHAHGAALVW